MKKPTTISKESVSEYREFVQLRLRKRVVPSIYSSARTELAKLLIYGLFSKGPSFGTGRGPPPEKE